MERLGASLSVAVLFAGPKERLQPSTTYVGGSESVLDACSRPKDLIRNKRVASGQVFC